MRYVKITPGSLEGLEGFMEGFVNEVQLGGKRWQLLELLEFEILRTCSIVTLIAS